MADPLNPFRGGSLRLFTAVVANTDSTPFSPSRRKDERGRSVLVNTVAAGTFNFEVQARVDDVSPWVPIPVTLGAGPNIGDRVVVVTAADLNADDQITLQHDIWPQMRHSANTFALGASLDSWIVT